MGPLTYLVRITAIQELHSAIIAVSSSQAG